MGRALFMAETPWNSAIRWVPLPRPRSLDPHATFPPPHLISGPRRDYAPQRSMQSRQIPPLRRRGMCGAPACLRIRIPLLRAPPQNFRIRLRGRIEITHKSAFVLITYRLPRVLHEAHHGATPSTAEGFRGIHGGLSGEITFPIDRIYRGSLCVDKDHVIRRKSNGRDLVE